MMMRGVEKQHSSTVTSAMLGVFKTQMQTRNEFLSLVRRREWSCSSLAVALVAAECCMSA